MKCKQCSKSFKRKEFLKNHIAAVHSHEKVKFKCPACDRFCSTKYNLRKHFQQRHENENDDALRWVEPSLVPTVDIFNTKKFTCDLCQKKFTRKENLTNHLESYHKKEEKKFFCEECDQKFTNASTLKKHDLKFHSNDLCELCGATGRDHDPMCEMADESVSNLKLYLDRN